MNYRRLFAVKEEIKKNKRGWPSPHLRVPKEDNAPRCLSTFRNALLLRVRWFRMNYIEQVGQTLPSGWIENLFCVDFIIYLIKNCLNIFFKNPKTSSPLKFNIWLLIKPFPRKSYLKFVIRFSRKWLKQIFSTFFL